MSKRLHISLGYGGETASPDSVTTLPVEILDADGATLGRVTVQPQRSTAFDLPLTASDPVLLKLTLPSGEKRVERAVLGSRDEASVTLLTDYVSPHEWLNWSRVQVPVGSLPMLHFEGRGVGEIWALLWHRSAAGWQPASIDPQRQQSAPYALQFELDLPPVSSLLQVGGTRVPWRFVGLPGGGPVRVLMSAPISEDPRSEPVKVTWSRLRPDEEALLAYLARDSLRQAETLAGEPRLAERMLFGKYDDPISACVGAYYLLRAGQLSRLHDWPRNLYRAFPWLPDAAVLHATHLLRLAGPDLAEAGQAVRETLARGLPIFAEGLRLLHEAVQLLSAAPLDPALRDACSRIERYVLAQAWSSYAFSFHGLTPEEPNPDLVVGAPDAPRLLPLRRTVLKTSMRPEEGIPTGEARARPRRWRLPAKREIKAGAGIGSHALRLR